jgi:archaellum component FlaF (FlaF/FlaG flagellin family)
MFGSPKQFDCGIWENRLIYVGKQHASSIQKRSPKTFTRQLGNRNHVRQCSDKCRQYLSIFHDYTNDHVDIDNQDNDSVCSDVSVDMTKSNVKSTADYSVMQQGSSSKFKWNCKTTSYLCPLFLRFIRRNVIKDTTSLVNIWR